MHCILDDHIYIENWDINKTRSVEAPEQDIVYNGKIIKDFNDIKKNIDFRYLLYIIINIYMHIVLST